MVYICLLFFRCCIRRGRRKACGTCSCVAFTLDNFFWILLPGLAQRIDFFKVCVDLWCCSIFPEENLSLKHTPLFTSLYEFSIACAFLFQWTLLRKVYMACSSSLWFSAPLSVFSYSPFLAASPWFPQQHLRIVCNLHRLLCAVPCLSCASFSTLPCFVLSPRYPSCFFCSDQLSLLQLKNGSLFLILFCRV